MTLKKEKREFRRKYRLACQQLLELLNYEAKCRTKEDYHMLRAKFLAGTAVLYAVAEQIVWIAEQLPDEIRKVE